jgi:hypothetical protein
MISWFAKSYTWLFSGIGAAAVGSFIKRLFWTEPSTTNAVRDSSLSNSPIVNGSNNNQVNGPVIGELNVRTGADIQAYERRLPIYKAATQFVRDVLANLRPELSLIFRFYRDTEEALFLFDPTVDEYLRELAQKALDLHTIAVEREQVIHDNDVPDFAALVKKQTDIALWFTKQYDVIRTRFEPFLHLA